MVQPHRHAGVEKVAMLLVQPITSRSAVSVVVRHREQVPLDPQVAEHGRGRAKSEAVGATGRVAGRRSDVRAHHLRRDDQRRASLDQLTVSGVVAVRCPHPIGTGQDSGVDPATAAGARFPLDVGMGRP